MTKVKDEKAAGAESGGAGDTKAPEVSGGQPSPPPIVDPVQPTAPPPAVVVAAPAVSAKRAGLEGPAPPAPDELGEIVYRLRRHGIVSLRDVGDGVQIEGPGGVSVTYSNDRLR